MSIALCALFFSIWRGYVAHRHDRLSVRPHLTTPEHTDANEGLVRLELVNNGLGPAVIRSFEIRVDGKVVEPYDWSKTEAMLRILVPSLPTDAKFGDVGRNYVMPAGERFTIFEIRFGKMSRQKLQNIEKTFTRANLIVEYESLYGDKFRWIR